MRKRYVLLLLAAVPLLAGCGQLGYLWQAAQGQADLLLRARPISAVLSDPGTPDEVRRKLRLVEQVRDFATHELGLPDRGAYHKYSALGRPFVVWNVFSAPELGIQLRTSCFPVAGCVAYQGFFQEAAAQREGERRRAAGDDVTVGGVRGYSTLGYFPDPLLSSMLDYSDAQLARVIIHELAHPALYVAGDTAFSESFAVTLEEEGMRRWLERTGDAELARQDATEQQRQREWQQLLLSARGDLQALYVQTIPDAEKWQRKTEILETLHQQLTAKRREWFGPQVAEAPRQNNATLGAVAAYADLVPDFQQPLARVGGDIPAFIAAARACAAKPVDQRPGCLRGE